MKNKEYEKLIDDLLNLKDDKVDKILLKHDVIEVMLYRSKRDTVVEDVDL